MSKPARAALRSSAQPRTGQTNYSDGHSNRASRDIWERIVVHVATKSGMMQRCVRGGLEGTNTFPLPVRCNRPVLYIAGIRLCSGRITERLALAKFAARNQRNFAKLLQLSLGIRLSGRPFASPDIRPLSPVSLSMRQRLSPK